MYHEELWRPRPDSSVEECLRRHERTSKWLLVLGCVWVSFILLLVPSVTSLVLTLIRYLPPEQIVVALMVLGYFGSGRSR